MLNSIRNLFPRKTKSFDEFIEASKAEGCSIEIVPTITCTQGGTSMVVGQIGTFQYSLLLKSKTPRGQKVSYNNLLFERFGSSQGMSDSQDRSKAAIRLFLIAENKMEELAAKIPQVKILIIGSEGPFNEETFAQLHRDASKMGVTA